MVDKIWYNMEELIGDSEERGINRNIVECKGVFFNAGSGSDPVLIETQWNVKVNTGIPCGSLPHSINRNIVECKVIFYCKFEKDLKY